MFSNFDKMTNFYGEIKKIKENLYGYMKMRKFVWAYDKMCMNDKCMVI